MYGWGLVMIVAVNLFRIFMNDPAMLKWYGFTHILMGTINSFTVINMWSASVLQFGRCWGCIACRKKPTYHNGKKAIW
ncbi:hypothetical protein FD01_GL000389 [Lacticaseibacillus manihotivorans DSM 13343 = JCM 12514]|uniref:Uncharacterized protein n=2 Tax=Lacticaseibacillus manihotivorans TaxID=88233 RepID=A0A0R1QSJ9_9LACO|nr:hypothetical protein FD01_GL000389 [Lacticaseibacillus manihotivorans DSM 13343 = JCM 12514]